MSDSPDLDVSTPRTLSDPQSRALKMPAGSWWAVQANGSVYEINGKPYRGTTFKSLADLGLVEQFVLVPGDFFPTHAYRVTDLGRVVAATIKSF